MNEPFCNRTVAFAVLFLAATTAIACGSDPEHDVDPTSAAAPTAAGDTAAVSGSDEDDDDELPGATGLALQSAPAPAPAPDAPPPSVTDLDADGVQMLLPSATGASFRLGTSNANSTAGFSIENNVAAQPHALGSLTYWSTQAYNLSYAGGGTGKTSRLHIAPNTGAQKFTWRTQSGFLANANDLKNQELTVYVRVHDIFDPSRASVSLKIRGGLHSGTTGDLASCTLMRLSATPMNGTTTVFGKELTHPNYDWVTLAPAFAGVSLQDDQWVGMKLLSFAKPGDPKAVVNRLYVDTTPFDVDGTPTNGWQLLSEYVDVEGKSTGKYSKLADWRGSQTTVRIDGVSTVDFALVSVREVLPPS
jgi:hypothetical protein